MSKITDKELEALTIKMMEKTTAHYLNTYESKESDDINKLIEKDVAMRIVDIVPDRYTEITVNVIDFFGDIEIAAVFKTDSGFKLHVDYEYAVPYDPTSLIESFWSNPTVGRGSRVETLPEPRISLGVSSRGIGMSKDEQSDLEYFQQKVMRGLQLPENIGTSTIAPAPTSWAPLTEKTPVGSEEISTKTLADVIAEHENEKPTIDFSTISLLNPPDKIGLERHSAGMWCGVDLAKFDPIQNRADQLAKEMAAQIDKEMIEAIQQVAADPWAVPTFGLDVGSGLGYLAEPSDFEGVVITTDASAPVWYNPDTGSLQQHIEFSEDDLDLLDMTGQQIMEFV